MSESKLRAFKALFSVALFFSIAGAAHAGHWVLTNSCNTGSDPHESYAVCPHESTYYWLHDQTIDTSTLTYNFAEGDPVPPAAVAADTGTIYYTLYWVADNGPSDVPSDQTVSVNLQIRAKVTPDAFGTKDTTTFYQVNGNRGVPVSKNDPTDSEWTGTIYIPFNLYYPGGGEPSQYTGTFSVQVYAEAQLNPDWQSMTNSFDVGCVASLTP